MKASEFASLYLWGSRRKDPAIKGASKVAIHGEKMLRPPCLLHMLLQEAVVTSLLQMRKLGVRGGLEPEPHSCRLSCLWPEVSPARTMLHMPSRLTPPSRLGPPGAPPGLACLPLPGVPLQAPSTLPSGHATLGPGPGLTQPLVRGPSPAPAGGGGSTNVL